MAAYSASMPLVAPSYRRLGRVGRGTPPWYVLSVMKPESYPCPSCGFFVFDEPPGSFSICELCDWEDDAVQLQHPTMRGGANRESLVQYQQRSLERWPLSMKGLGTVVRYPQWRPFEPSDARIDAGEAPRSGLEYFHAVPDCGPGYYWRR